MNQVQGVVAHELGHVAGGPLDPKLAAGRKAGDRDQPSRPWCSARSAIAAGAGDAGMGIMMAGQRAAMGELLAFTRTQEATADATGSRLSLQGRNQRQGHARLLRQAAEPGISPRDLRQGQLTTAPTRSPRNASRRCSRSCKSDPAWNKPVDAALDARFQRVKAKLMGFVEPAPGGAPLSGERPEHSRPLRPRLRLSSRRLSRESAERKRTRCSRSIRTTPSSSS